MTQLYYIENKKGIMFDYRFLTLEQAKEIQAKAKARGWNWEIKEHDMAFQTFVNQWKLG